MPYRSNYIIVFQNLARSNKPSEFIASIRITPQFTRSERQGADVVSANSSRLFVPRKSEGLPSEDQTTLVSSALG